MRMQLRKYARVGFVLLACYSFGGAGSASADLEPWQDDFIRAASAKYDVWYWKLEATIRCETGNYDMRVITGEKLGSQGEIGAVQLHPRGLLNDFYMNGYTNPRSFEQSVDYLAMKIAENARNRFYWSCYPRD